jgi:hypothetical protein
MAALGGEAAEMATQQCSTEAVVRALIWRWLRVRGGEIGTGVGAVDNGGALIVPFIGSYGGGRRAVKGREAVAAEP